MDYLIDLTVVGLSLGMVYGLVALGISFIYSGLDIVHFAHGEIYMVGAFLGVTVLNLTGLNYPALIVIAANFDPSRALVLSQVFLSFGIPFAMIPLLMFTRDKKLMGNLVNSRFTNYAAYGVATLIIGLNIFLLYQTLFARG